MIPCEGVITPNQQLAPGERLIVHAVVHGRNVDEFSFVTSWRNSDTASACWVSRSQTQTRRAGLCRPITFNDGAGEDNTQELEHLRVQRGRTGGDKFKLPTEQLSNLGCHRLAPKCNCRTVANLLEDEAVPERMGVASGSFKLLQLSLDCSPEQGPLQTRGVGSGHNSLVDPVQ